MSELSGPDLRKAALEALGEKLFFADGKHGSASRGGSIVFSAGGFYLKTGKTTTWKGKTIPCVDTPPAIESDPAVSIYALENLCGKREWIWELNRTRDGGVICIITEVFGGGEENELANERGGHVSEAIARAIVESIEER